MGFRGVSMGSLLLILVIVILLFGTKRITTTGKDLASALKAFRQGMKDEEGSSTPPIVDQTKKEDEGHV